MPIKKRAVIVGINDYDDSELDNLEGAVNDATDMYELLKNRGDFEIEEGHFLINEEATSRGIRKALSDLFWRTEPCNLMLFYFSGHGIIDGYNTGYIAPSDMLKDQPFVCGIRHEELGYVCMNSIGKASVVILDSCYSGGAAGDRSPLNIKEAFRPFDDLTQETRAEGKIVLTSTDDHSVAKEDGNCAHVVGSEPHPHGLFTFHLLEGLDGKAKNESGLITLGNLVKYVENQFEDNVRQKPQIKVTKGYKWGDIRIALSHEQFNQVIATLLDEARFLDRDDPVSQFVAAIRIAKVLDLEPENKEALDHKSEINDIFSEWKGKSGKWCIKNEEDVVQKAAELRIPIQNVWRSLSNLIRFLDFDGVNKLDKNDRMLLSSVCQVSTEQLSIDDFLEKCKVHTNPPSRLQTARTASRQTK